MAEEASTKPSRRSTPAAEPLACELRLDAIDEVWLRSHPVLVAREALVLGDEELGLGAWFPRERVAPFAEPAARAPDVDVEGVALAVDNERLGSVHEAQLRHGAEEATAAAVLVDPDGLVRVSA